MKLGSDELKNDLSNYCNFSGVLSLNALYREGVTGKKITLLNSWELR